MNKIKKLIKNIKDEYEKLINHKNDLKKEKKEIKILSEELKDLKFKLLLKSSCVNESYINYNMDQNSLQLYRFW